MSSEFTRDHVKISLAKILQTLGCHTINTTPLEILTDILQNYLFQLSKLTSEYANEFGFTDPNFDHLGLAFREMGISLSELEEYVKYVNFGVTATPVSKFPVHKEDQLNFLKPGSKEVVTRPVHIHEHLPPMNPILTGAIVEKPNSLSATENEDEICSNEKDIFKKPPDIPTTEFKKLKRDEEGSRPTREISSVMMTTSGFLSPAREGKLPESKSPIPPPPIEPSPSSAPAINPSSCTDHSTEVLHIKKPQKFIKKVEKKKERVGKELFKPDNEDRVKKSHSRDSVKIKQIKALGTSALLSNLPQGLDVVKLPPIPHIHKMNSMKFNSKALQAARLKTEKLNTTITPLPMRTPPVNNLLGNCHSQINFVDKLLNVPDKKKINILRKISNVKEKIEDKMIRKEDAKEEPVSPPELVIDEPEDMIPKLAHLRGDITIEPINPPIHESIIKAEPMFFEDSSGAPSTPKTPEMICTPAPILMKDKKRRKPKVRKPKPEGQPHLFSSYNDSDTTVERPKTPKGELDLVPQQQQSAPSTPDFSFGNLNPYSLTAGRPNIHFLANFGGPGLIPPPLGNPLNPLSNPLFPNSFPLLNLPDFAQHPYLSQNLPSLPNPLANFLPKMEETPNSSPSILEPVSLPPPRTPEPVATSSIKLEKYDKKSKEHKKEKKDKLKKKAKKEKLKAKAEKKEEKKKIKKKEKREKRKEKEVKEPADASSAVPKLTLKLKSPSPRPVTPDTTTKKLNIKPVVKKIPELSEEQDSEMSSLAKISALVTGPPKTKNVPPTVVSAEDINKHEEMAEVAVKPIIPGPGKPKVHLVKAKPVKPTKKKHLPIKKDAEGNEVWICPACSRQDDGSPMIGCDGCDAWYHWVCVGIQVPPDENEDWYCRYCLLKKDEDLQSDKKKKRKRKEKKEHQ